MNNNQKGVSLVEIVIAIIGIGILAVLVAAIPRAISSINNSRNSSVAREIASRKLEAIRKTPYANFAEGENSFNDDSLASLKNAAAVYKIEACPEDLCQNGEEAKKITIKINWLEGNSNNEITLSTLVTEGGLGQ